jgi:signal transduction histidine kinase
VAKLETNDGCGRLPGEHLEAIRNAGLQRDANAGQVIFREEDPGDGLYLVVEGMVEIFASLEKDGKQVLSRVGPGEVFGEMAIIENAPRSAAAMAVEPTKLFFVPREAMLNLIESTPAMAISLMRLVSHRLREFNHQYLRDVLQAERLSVVGRFTRAIMHDLKNPLNLIGLTAEVAGMPEASPEMRAKASADIRQQVEKITAQITEVLEFADGPTKGKLIPATMSFREFMRDLIEEFRSQAAQHGVHMVCDNLPETLLPLNPRRLQRAFSNLFVNALEAMPGGGQIMIRSRDEGHEVVCEIEDSGPGLAPEIQARVFEPFATHGKAFGTGLGLSICRRIVEDHGGWIRHRSEAGKGAIFIIGLPVAGAVAGDRANPATDASRDDIS